MKVGVPTEIKADEYRVALTPIGVRELVEHRHEVVVQSGAGQGSAIPDDAFAAQGARIVPDEESVFAEAELILKVKEPQPGEVSLLRPGTRSSRTSTWPPIPSSRGFSASPGPPASPTRRSRTRAGACRCSHR